MAECRESGAGDNGYVVRRSKIWVRCSDNGVVCSEKDDGCNANGAESSESGAGCNEGGARCSENLMRHSGNGVA